MNREKSIEQAKMWMQCVEISVPLNKSASVGFFLGSLGLFFGTEGANNMSSGTFQVAFGETMKRFGTWNIM